MLTCREPRATRLGLIEGAALKLMKLYASLAPPRREALAALLVGGILASWIIFLPRLVPQFGPQFMVAAVLMAAFLVAGIFHRGWAGTIAAVAAVLMARRAFVVPLFDHMPEAFRGVALYQTETAVSGLHYIGQRVLVLAPAVIVVLGLALAQSSSRGRLKEWFAVRPWRSGICWPLPWWGIGPMPLRWFMVVAMPLAVVSFIPVVSWPATNARWASASWGLFAVVPVMAMANAILEELIYRLGLVSILSRSLSPAASAIVAALIFASMHFHGGVPRGLFALAILSFGALYVGNFMIVERGLSAAVTWHVVLDMFAYLFVMR